MKWSKDVLLVGIDWGREEHAVCVLDVDGEVLSEWTLKHSGSALQALTDRLSELAGGKADHVHVCIELTRGSLVETLMERGFHVYGVNPKQSDRYRDRHFPAGTKDDRRDAFVAADALRTDAHKLRELRPDDPLTIQLREHVRIFGDLSADENRITNRLRDQLLRHFPQLVNFNAAISDPWMLDLIEKAPTPALARTLKAADAPRCCASTGFESSPSTTCSRCFVNATSSSWMEPSRPRPTTSGFSFRSFAFCWIRSGR